MSSQEYPNENEDWNTPEEDDEDFGLPEVNFDPVDDEEPAAAPEPEAEVAPEPEPVPEPESESTVYAEPSYTSSDDTSYSDTSSSDDNVDQLDKNQIITDHRDNWEEDDRRLGPNWGLIIGVLLIVALLGFAVYQFWWLPNQEESYEADNTEEVQDRKPLTPLEDTAYVEPEPEPEPVVEERTEGIIETINAPSGRFYVVVSSNLDDDLAMDYAKKLAKDGVDVTILAPPEGQRGYYRVTIDNFSTWSEADARAKELRGTMNQETWAFRF